MNGRRALLLALLPALAGCSGSAPAGTPTPGAGDDGVDAGGAPLEVLPVDPWDANETERVLFEGSVQAVECLQSAEGVATAAAGTTRHGCARLPFEAGTKIPFGTATLRVDGDAGQALQRGSWHLEVWTMGRNTLAEAQEDKTTEVVHSWEVGLGERDWDPAELPDSIASVELWAHNAQGEVSTLDGTVAAKVTAVRDPSWRPTARPDMWNMTSARHDFAEADAVVLFNKTWAFTQDAQAASTPLELTGIVLRGATRVVAGATWAWDDCHAQAALQCRALVGLVSDGQELHWSLSDPETDAGPAHDIRVWASPRPVVWDEDDATASLTEANVVVLWWSNTGVSGSMGAPPTVSGTLTVRIEAWRGDVDLDAFKARLGV